MKVLDHLAQAAAVLLLAELLVLVLIFVGLAGGLAFGLRWVRGKTTFAAEKATWALKLVDKYVDRALDIAVQPIIKVSGFAETVKGALHAIQRRVKARSTAP